MKRIRVRADDLLRLIDEYNDWVGSFDPADRPEYLARFADLRKKAVKAMEESHEDQDRWSARPGASMNWREAEKWLKQVEPLMRCGNRTEFKHRLQWLSEGMLRNHIKNLWPFTENQNEIELYRTYKEWLKCGSKRVS